MLDDLDVPLALIEPGSDGCKDTVVAIARHANYERTEKKWADHLKLLTPSIGENIGPYPNNGAQEPTSGADDPGSEDVCACLKAASRLFGYNDRCLAVVEQPLDVDSDDSYGCYHYIAVSYCWKSLEAAEYNGEPFTIVSEAELRQPKCPSSLLDRVINFASFYRFRYIWIDQECIDQDNAEDKQNGIQAMDLVYENADTSLAILETRIEEQRHVDALETMFNSEDCNEYQYLNLVEVLETILNDPWFERAWTLQESTSGNRRMVMLVKCNPLLEIPSIMSLDSDIELQLTHLHEMISGWLATQHELGFIKTPQLVARCEEVIEKWFKTMVADEFENVVDYEQTERTLCNAAEAIGYLSRRKNSVVSDRLAILANLCGCEVRLDTLGLQDLTQSLSLCALTLSVLNGDLSMMVGRPETGSANPHNVNSPDFESDEDCIIRHGFSWFPPGACSLYDGRYTDKRLVVVRIQVSSLTDNGLLLKGCVWIADGRIDCSRIQNHLTEEFGEDWISEIIQTPESGDHRQLPVQIRNLLVAMIVALLWHLHTTGFDRLASHLWSRLRRRGAGESEKMEADDTSSFGSFITDQSLMNKEPHRISRGQAYERQADQFRSLENGLTRWILERITKDGELFAFRPVRSPKKPQSYSALFDKTEPGDEFLTPSSNFGTDVPRYVYGWYPMTWKIDRCGEFEGCKLLSSRGLVLGSWKADNDLFEMVYLR